MAKCQHYTFDGVFHYKSSFMLIHLYIGWVFTFSVRVDDPSDFAA